jgi:hypothetical protein
MSAQPFIREPIRANPLPHEADVIARAQSLLTKNGRVGPVLSFEEAQLVVECAKKAREQKTNH